MRPISIVVPMYAAQDTIVHAVKSVIGQTHRAWELVLVADDNHDYESILGRAGLLRDNIHFLSTGRNGSGSPTVRNLGLSKARYSFCAILDADDFMHPQKLERVAPWLDKYPLVTCALQITRSDHTPIRTIGQGPDRHLSCGDYKFINFSSDSMLVYNRDVCDPTFDSQLSCVTDLDFMLRCFQVCGEVYHLGTPLHYYVKRTQSVTNKPGANRHIYETKKLILNRIEVGEYCLNNSEAKKKIKKFLKLAMSAEAQFEKALELDPESLYEDNIEQFLNQNYSLAS